MSERTPFDDLRPLCQALVDAGGERCLWGSDWPHVAYSRKMVKVGDLLDTLALCVDDPTARDRILVMNPHHLFGFEADAMLSRASVGGSPRGSTG